MAQAKVEKIRILGHGNNEQKIMNELQECGMLELLKPSATNEGFSPYSQELLFTKEELNLKISKIEQAIKFLTGFGEKEGFFASFLSKKILLEKNEIDKLKDLEKNKIYENILASEDEINRLSSRIEHTTNEINSIMPWTGVLSLLSEIKKGKNVEFITGTLPIKVLDTFIEKCQKDFLERISIEIISKDEEKAYILLCIFSTENDMFRPADLGFTKIELPKKDITAKEYVKDLESELKDLEKEKNRVIKISGELIKEKSGLMLLRDYLFNIKKREDAKEEILRFKYAFVIDGWIKQDDFSVFEKNLRDRFKEIEIIKIKPEEGEEPPTVLNNPPVVQPFEMLTNLYGLPNSRDLDPTPLLLPFFVLYFGLCITDAGYGVVIMLLSYLFIRRSKTKPSNLLYVLFWGGLLTIFGGAITGSWFGDAIDKFQIFSVFKGLKMFMIFDPMVNPIIFFALALALGFIQICFGLCAKIYKLIKNKMFIDAICDPTSLLLIMLGIPILVIAVMKKVPLLFSISIAFLIFGLLNTFFYAFKNAVGAFSIRFFLGGYAVYSAITGCFLGDTLSFSRLLALGMATSGIALAVNVIAEFVAGIPYVGLILAAIVLIGGHTFNIVLQAFGAFVHSMRLQYVEFFSKFYESGGRKFVPFSKEYKYIAVRETNAQN